MPRHRLRVERRAESGRLHRLAGAGELLAKGPNPSAACNVDGANEDVRRGARSGWLAHHPD
jgi:hypothetical protein